MQFDVFHPSSAVILTILISMVLPLVSSLITRLHWPSEVQGAITVALATLTGFLMAWKAAADAGHDFAWRTAAGYAIGSYLIAALARLQLWAGTHTDARLLAIGSPTAARNFQPEHVAAAQQSEPPADGSDYLGH